MTNPNPDVAAVAGKLSVAQKAWLTEHARKGGSKSLYPDAWLSYPPKGTFDVLNRLGLLWAVGLITEKGLAVRSYLLSQEAGEGSGE